MRIKSFTLIEMLGVLVIIGVFSTIGMTSFKNSRVRARDVMRKQQVGQLDTAFKQYYSVNNAYAPEYAANKRSISAYATRDPRDNSNVGGAGWCLYVTTTDLELRGSPVNALDPAFVSERNLEAYTGFLLPYVSKPETLASTMNTPFNDEQWVRNCPVSASSVIPVERRSGRISYHAMRKYFGVRAVLESSKESLLPANNCYHFNDARGSYYMWFYSGTYPAFEGYPLSGCDRQYKIFARGNLEI